MRGRELAVALDAGWRQIEKELQRRTDLGSNLVNTVKGFAAREKQVLVEVSEARGREASTEKRLAVGRETIARCFGLEHQIGEHVDYYETLAKGKS